MIRCKTEISASEDDLEDEDLIEERTCVYTFTHCGYIKRLPEDTYKVQNRGGKGITAMTTREEDFVEELFVGSTHNLILFFTNSLGKYILLRVTVFPKVHASQKE